VTRGIRQGGDLSAYLFALYVDDIVSVVERTRLGYYYRSVCNLVLSLTQTTYYCDHRLCLPYKIYYMLLKMLSRKYRLYD